ncbi:MAG: lamin tail domain-containing protein [Chitinophagaceae bacterium]|nr:lamin tail domain-containing protein [Chitinophagaceae bacterium]
MKRLLFLILSIIPTIVSAQNRYDVVIDELMVDPSPQLGLPNAEWLEIKNRSSSPINLQNWRIVTSSTQSGLLPTYVLKPDSFLIICSPSAMSSLAAFGSVVTVSSFPALDNDGQVISLKAASGTTIHAVGYSSGWYRNNLKKQGGWTLEMIDTDRPCAGINNWRASENLSGGTPGIKNSVESINTDNAGPIFQRTFTVDDTTIILVFDESLDSLRATNRQNYSIDGGIILKTILPLAPMFDRVRVTTTSSLTVNTVYDVAVMNVADCMNNISSVQHARLGLPGDAIAGHWVVNEILFNPRANTNDYIEFYNNGPGILDAANLYIANRNANGILSSIKVLTAEPFLIFPGDHIVVTEDLASLQLNYLVKHPGNVIEFSLPSFPDDEGAVVTLNRNGEVVDEVKYKDDWHFQLLTSAEGVALERLDPSLPSQNSANWHSAASTAGYGTPTYKNSQLNRLPSPSIMVEAIPKVFSPDNDGIHDVATLQYKMEQPGYVANVIIFDAAGRPVRRLVNNNILGLEGYWNWDGLDDKGAKLQLGPYIIYTEIFHTSGKTRAFKNTVVLARRLK